MNLINLFIYFVFYSINNNYYFFNIKIINSLREDQQSSAEGSDYACLDTPSETPSQRYIKSMICRPYDLLIISYLLIIYLLLNLFIYFFSYNIIYLFIYELLLFYNCCFRYLKQVIAALDI